MELNNLRGEIDEIDRNLVYWLEKRFETVRKVAAFKKQTGMPVLDARRERAVVEKAASLCRDKDYVEGVCAVFREMMAQSRGMQETLLSPTHGQDAEAFAQGEAAYCGISGSHTEEAAIRYFGKERVLLPQPSFEAVVKSVLCGQARFGLLPVENSLAGSVTEAEDLLWAHDVYITGEVILSVRQHLLGVPGAGESDVRFVCSHPQAIGQCARFIAEHGYEVLLSSNTALAAKDVAKKNDTATAAIAPLRAAQLYGLSVLREDIQDNRDNYTRFAVIERERREEGNKLSVVCVIPHRSGSLFALLRIFAEHGLNLTKLLARPIPDSAWHYRFHFDLSGNVKDPNVAGALTKAREQCDFFKITGAYRGALG